MEAWRDKACEYFPELRDLIKEQTVPMDLWIELYYKLVRAYDKQPLDEQWIGRLYEYAAWCLAQPDTGDAKTDPSSAAAFAFIEDLPRDQRIADDMYRWVSLETFDACEPLLRHSLSDESYKKLAANFRRKKKEFSGSPRL